MGVRFYGHMREARFDYKTNDRPTTKTFEKPKAKIEQYILHTIILYNIHTYCMYLCMCYVAFSCVDAIFKMLIAKMAAMAATRTK